MFHHVALIFMGVSLLLEEEVMDVVTSVNSTVSAASSSSLAPTSACASHGGGNVGLTSWAACGVLWQISTSMRAFGSTRAPRPTRRRESWCTGMASSHMLLYKDARGQTNLDDAIGKGLLLPHEATVLQPLPSRTQMVFAWLIDFFQPRALRGGLQGPGHDARAACVDAGAAHTEALRRGPRRSWWGARACLHAAAVPVRPSSRDAGAGGMCGERDGQGAKTGWILSSPQCLGDAVLPTTHHYRFEVLEGCPPALYVYHWTATCLIFCGLLVSIVIYPVIYHGLLSIGVMISNPLGTELVDFPGSFYQHVMKAELSGFAKCTDAVDLKTDRAAGGRWWEGLGPAGRSATR